MSCSVKLQISVSPLRVASCFQKLREMLQPTAILKSGRG